uniref:Ovule protein n=1 Tax=Strongyloides papillosus TaxID=174720 RepID=A0A0N5B1R0_STREA
MYVLGQLPKHVCSRTNSETCMFSDKFRNMFVLGQIPKHVCSRTNLRKIEKPKRREKTQNPTQFPQIYLQRTLNPNSTDPEDQFKLPYNPETPTASYLSISPTPNVY